VNAADLVRFARRDWDALAESKTAHWRAVKSELGEGAGICIGDALRRSAQAQNPGWPGDDDRARDLESHARVADALERVHGRRRS